jgi:hypothetical protein
MGPQSAKVLGWANQMAQEFYAELVVAHAGCEGLLCKARWDGWRSAWWE